MKRRRFFLIVMRFLFLLGLFWVFSPHSNALTIEITKGAVASIPLVFQGFSEGGHEVGKVVENDLKLSGIFRMLGNGTQTAQEAFHKPNFSFWKPFPGAVFIAGLCHVQGLSLEITFRIYDVARGHKLHEGTIKGAISQQRAMAHKISNAIYERLTGEKGYFDTQIIYTAENGPPTQRQRRIVLMDHDGENARFLTPETLPCFLASGSPTENKITYIAFHHKLFTKIHLKDLTTDLDKVIPTEGVVSMSIFSPSGKELIFCEDHHGVSTAYCYNLATERREKLLQSKIIEGSVSFTPDGKQFVFASDRTGKSQLFIKEGGIERRLSKDDGGRYFAPKWSPDGEWIAFVKSKGGSYYLGIIDKKGQEERLLAKDHLIDEPSWSPTSRLILFAAQQKRFGPYSLYIVDVSGRSLRRVSTSIPGESANHPFWWNQKK